MRNKTFFRLLSSGMVTMAFVGCASQYDIYAPGENLQALTQVTDGENICRTPFGGDNGHNLFFAVIDRRDPSSNIYLKENPFSAAMSSKTSGRNRNIAPTFCLATNKLAFGGQLEGSFYRDIYMINAAQDNALTQVTNTPDAEENYPSLSLDGRYVVYEKTQGSARMIDTQIWMKNLQTNENTMLANGRMPSFSPDGKTIAFVKYTGDGTRTCLWTMNTDGTNQMQITDATMGEVWHPRFSPDGNEIVFQCNRRQKKDFDLYVVSKNGNNLTQLTLNKSYDGEPYWANDGNIYFTSDRGSKDGRTQIWRFKYGHYNAAPAPVAAPAATPAPTSNATPASEPSYAAYHVVKQNETITQIAQQYGVTVRDIVKWNNLSTMTLTPGKRLKVSQ